MIIKERPILFSAPMVQAIMLGEKTQTRRDSKLPFPDSLYPVSYDWIHVEQAHGVICPYGIPGDRLWVRETFYNDNDSPLEKDVSKIYYRADSTTKKWCCDLLPDCLCELEGMPKLTPSIFMPRWASRILLEITSVRIERRDSISEEDAAAEGVAYALNGKGILNNRQAFRMLWGRINGQKSLEINPWVWAIGFRVLEGLNG